MTKKIHVLIKELRMERGISQAAMAHQLDIARPTYIQIEKGVREPNFSELQKIADILTVPATFFFEKGQKAKKIHVELPKETEPREKEEDIRISVPQKNMDKFKEVLLYILEKVGAKPNVGETVIYKLLYFIDFDFYEKFEEQLIGATYIKNKFGPTPIEFKKIVEQMIEKGEIEAVRSKRFQYEQKKYLPLRHPNLKKLSAEEVNHINDVLARLGNKSAKELSDYSHADTPWIVHEMGEPISYETVFYRDQEHSVKTYDDEL
jgi:transcriptional regulator with XRE-family HTH domain